MSKRFRSFQALIATLSGLMLIAAVTTGPRPRQIIEETADQVLAVLRDSAKTDEQRIAQIEEIAYAHFDFATMSRLVLGRNWKKFSDEQKADFVEQFTQYLANDYSKRVDQFEQQEIVFLGERDEPRGDVTVMTKIVDARRDNVLIDYRMRHREEEWRIIDVVIEGISLVANFRDQFREVMSRVGPAGLLERIREKNAASVRSRDAAASELAAPDPGADALASSTVAE